MLFTVSDFCYIFKTLLWKFLARILTAFDLRFNNAVRIRQLNKKNTVRMSWGVSTRGKIFLKSILYKYKEAE